MKVFALWLLLALTAHAEVAKFAVKPVFQVPQSVLQERWERLLDSSFSPYAKVKDEAKEKKRLATSSSVQK